MAAILEQVTAIFGAVMSWLETLVAVVAGGTVGSGETAVTYTGEPLLMLFILIPVIFLGVSMFRRLLRL